MRRHLKKLIVIVVIITVTALPALFYTIKLSPLSWHMLAPMNNDSGLAMRGYDPVSYFRHGLAVSGDPALKQTRQGITWYFSSAESMQQFITEPEKYQPQFGGYCARAVASGLTADIDPTLWHIENGKLYLFYDQGARRSFISLIDEGIIEKAEAEWLQYKP